MNELLKVLEEAHKALPKWRIGQIINNAISMAVQKAHPEGGTGSNEDLRLQDNFLFYSDDQKLAAAVKELVAWVVPTPKTISSRQSDP